jgi:G3E family GTPase
MVDIAPIPLLLVSGTLGAGKTTFINEILRRQNGRRLAAIVNDFGSINIDAAILEKSGQPVYGMENGCICCTLQGDLIRTLRNVISLDRRPDGVIIEASGLADPRAILSALQDPFIGGVATVEALLTVVDARHQDCADPLWRAQVEAADHLYLSNTENSVQSGDRIAAELAGLGKRRYFHSADLADLAGGMLFVDLRDNSRPTRFTATEALPQARVVPLEWKSDRPIYLAGLAKLVEELGPCLLRAKGLIRVTEEPDRPMLFQLSGARATLSPLAHHINGAFLILFGTGSHFDVASVRARLDALSAP